MRRIEEDHLEKLLEILRCRLRKKICLKKIICSLYGYSSRAKIYTAKVYYMDKYTEKEIKL
jgi:hypothetical protein